MDIKQTQPIDVISISKKATLKTIMEDIGMLPEQLMEDLNKHNVEPSGPMIFVYRGCNGEMENTFDLEISQPVKSTQGYQGSYQVNTLEPFKCVERTYKGNMNDMGAKGYEPFIADIEKNGLEITDQSREIYTRYDGPESEDNLTELQLGVA